MIKSKLRNLKSGLLKSVLFRDTMIYGLTNALYTGLPLLLMPFLVAVMSPEDYGAVDLYRSIGQVLIPILGLSTVQSVSRFYFDLEEVDFKKFVSSVVIFQFVSGILGICIILIFSVWIEEKYRILAYLSVIYFAFNQVMEGLLVVYRVQKQSAKYLFIRVSSVVLDLALLAGFYFFYTSYDWTYRVYPNVISTVIFGAISVLLLFKYGYKPIFDKKLFKQAVNYSYPLILHMVSGYIINIGDRFFILHYLGEKGVGNYAVAYQLGMAVNFFYTSFNLAWTPTFYDWMKKRKYEAIKRVKKIIYVTVPLLGTIVILMWYLLHSKIAKLSEYEISFEIVSLIVVSYVILSLYKFEANYFLYNKKTKKLSTITLISAITTIMLNVVLLPRIGLIGAAIATLVSFVIMYLLIFIINRNEKIIE